MARKRRIGTVLSDTNNKTIIVGVDWTQRDPVYGKSKRRITRFSASDINNTCLLYTSPSPRDGLLSRMPSSA